VQLASRTSCTDPGSVPPRPRAGINLSARAWRSSAITYLTIFPVEKIKIDKSFIKNALALHIALNSPLAQASRSLNFWILPDPVSGNASTMIQCLGVLCGASEARM
jgi:predicted signal transduction protein with EAL and GGDEF domain